MQNLFIRILGIYLLSLISLTTPKTPNKASKKVGVLTAAYEDHGSTNAPNERKLGRQTIILKWQQ